MEKNGIQAVMGYLPVQVREALQHMEKRVQEQVQEIRLRASCPLCITVSGREEIVGAMGERTSLASRGVLVTQKMVEQSFQAICEYSIYRYTKEIREGFITISGGNRVGIAGSAVYREGVLTQMRYISGLNFRIAHAVKGCADSLYQKVFGVQPCSLLLSGNVGSGKTTMLRDLCRLLGEKWRVSLVDERSEIAAMHAGVPRYDVGIHTDVLDGFPRGEGLLTALRVLTPQILVCDEIGTQEDVQAILRVHGCGVPVVASVHAGSWEELQRRCILKRLLEEGVFTHVAQLSALQLGKVQTIRQVIAC